MATSGQAMHNWLNNIPDSTVLMNGRDISWTKSDLQKWFLYIRESLRSRKQPFAPVAILADNSPEWIAIDLATQALGITLVPLPTFFTPAQWAHAIRTSGAQAIFCVRAEHANALGFTDKIPFDGKLALYEAAQEIEYVNLEGIQKITYTSGTTSEPKGVCLTAAQQWDVTYALHERLADIGIQRHLSLLPLSVLLENIAGVYTSLLSGATSISPPLAETGLTGASGFDPTICLEAIQRHQAESIILLPQMLQALVAASTAQDERIRSLKFVAVGGARTPASLILAAREKGFPVYEGYGLSECSSVVSLNRPDADRPGSVGKPLPNRLVRIAADGEIEIGGAGFSHYLGEAPYHSEWLSTGDIGHLDEDGYLFISGRKKNILITSYGRNVLPEWPESVLLGTGAVAQSVVFGDARPYLVAAIVPASSSLDRDTIQAAVDKANQELPDYARIHRWISVEPFSPVNGLATLNGRPKRSAIWECYQSQIERLYKTQGE